MKKLIALACTFLAGCSSNVENYAEQKPEMDFYSYFTGKVDGWGTITGPKGDVTHRFHVLMDGKIQKDENGNEYLQLDEVFTYANGDVKERYWKVHQTNVDGVLVGEAPEVPGGAKGQQDGSAIRWKYKFDLPYNGKITRVDMDDWMWMVDDTTLMNKNVIRKYGIKVGELNILFRKPEGK